MQREEYPHIAREPSMYSHLLATLRPFAAPGVTDSQRKVLQTKEQYREQVARIVAHMEADKIAITNRQDVSALVDSFIRPPSERQGACRHRVHLGREFLIFIYAVRGL